MNIYVCVFVYGCSLQSLLIFFLGICIYIFQLSLMLGVVKSLNSQNRIWFGVVSRSRFLDSGYISSTFSSSLLPTGTCIWWWPVSSYADNDNIMWMAKQWLGWNPGPLMTIWSRIYLTAWNSHLSIKKKKKNLIFLSTFRFTEKLNRKFRDFP